MYGVNPSSPSKCCLAEPSRAAGVGHILNRLGTILDCPPSSRESHAWVDLLRMLQSSSYAASKLTILLSCSMTVQHSIIFLGVISDVTVNKAVGYKMYIDVDDSYNVWYHQFILEMF